MRCQICGIECEKTGRNQKYCKKCAYQVILMKNRMRFYEKQRKIEFHKHNIGTTNFFEHPANDFGVEYRRIQIQIKKLGFRRQFT